jgi:hypothetical protein
MFLRWIAQLLSLLGDTSNSELVYPLLERLAHDYPQALYHPFQLSRDDISEGEFVTRLFTTLRRSLL